MAGKAITFVVNVKFEGVTNKEKPPQTFVHAYDSTGQYLASAPVEKDQARLSLPSASAGRTVRFLLGPPVDETETPPLSSLSRVGAYEKRLRLDLKNPRLDVVILDPVWKLWLLCSCVVRGRLVKRFTLPDGTIKELPICHARVTICEVDSIPKIIFRLPDDLLFRLRDELIAVIRRPFPPPPPEPDSIRSIPGLLPELIPSPETRTAFEGLRSLRADVGSSVGASAADAAQPMEPLLFDAETQKHIRTIAGTASRVELQQGLIGVADLIRPYICGWPWLEPFFVYKVDCIKTVAVDDDGRFETTIKYLCFGDKPDLYFKAEQWHGFFWETIYKPSVRCHTYWNYDCGSEIVINVTDPSAIPCAPDDPVDPPLGVTKWVMPFAVGGTKIWGKPPGMPTPVPASDGWVKTDGFTDYGGFVNAPFGSYLGFRNGFSNNIPSAGMTYYRWSYRKVGTIVWKHMADPVYRHYVKQSPAMLPTFPAHPLGPHTIGANSELFQFKPVAAPGPDPGDPPGTITYWPTDDFFGDIYSGFLNTAALPPSVGGAAGQYQIRLEVFDGAGNQVPPGPATFRFIVPIGLAADGLTIEARQAEVDELVTGGFVFNLQIDNNQCTGSIDPPAIGATAVADECGFLRYDPTSSAPVTIAFHSQHPNNHATFSFSMVRGATPVTAAGASGEVAALPAGAYAGDGVGNFTHNFARSELMNTCVNAAFSENLYVFAKATTGWGSRISSYDASAVRAFALAPEEP